MFRWPHCYLGFFFFFLFFFSILTSSSFIQHTTINHLIFLFLILLTDCDKIRVQFGRGCGTSLRRRRSSATRIHLGPRPISGLLLLHFLLFLLNLLNGSHLHASNLLETYFRRSSTEQRQRHLRQCLDHSKCPSTRFGIL